MYEFLFIVVGLFFFALVGHGLWLVFAWVLAAMVGKAPVPKPRKQVEEWCAACGGALADSQARCAWCGLDQDSPAAKELADLEATARQLQRFQAKGVLEPSTFTHLQTQVLTQRRKLTHRFVPRKTEELAVPLAPAVEVHVPKGKPDETFTARPEEAVPSSASAAPVPERLSWQRLDELLAICPNMGQLADPVRQQALDWYRQAQDHDLNNLSAASQLALAHLCIQEGMADDALRAFRRLLNYRPGYLPGSEAALEAARLAIREGHPDEARWFIDRALAKPAVGEVHGEARQLLRSLRGEEPVAALKLTPVLEENVVVPEVLTEPQPPPASEPPAPSRPRRSLSELLAAFMEQSNILWGELVGGLLIVGFSIGLVINQWSNLEQNPVYQFGIFVGITAALFGAGLYTLSHWKLESTSRGLLIIATLLVPLNFLAITAQTQGSGGLLETLAEGASLAIFAGLLVLAGRVLVPGGRWLFTLAVLGASASQLLVPRILGLEGNLSWCAFVLLGCLPVACHGLGIGGVLYRSTHPGPLQARLAGGLFFLLGIATFALAVALGFLLYWNLYPGNVRVEDQLVLSRALPGLALLIALAGVPIMAGGIIIHHGLAQDPEAGALRTGGTAVALLGMLVLVGALLLAWPHPQTLILVGALDFLALTLVAFRYGLPVAHAVALPCLAVSFLTTYHLARGNVDFTALRSSMGELALSAESGSALIALFFLLGGVAEVLARWGKRPHDLAYALGSGGVVLVSLILVTVPWQGLVDAQPASLVYGLAGVGSLAMNARWRRPLLSSLGFSFLVGATLWALWGLQPDRIPLWGSTLAVEGLVLVGLAVGLAWWTGGWKDMPVVGQESLSLVETYREPLARTGEGVALLAVVAALWGGLSALSWVAEHVVTGGCLFGLFLLLALVERRTIMAQLAGLALIATVAAAAGWWGSLGEVARPEALIALSVAVAGLFMAALAIGVAGREDRGGLLDPRALVTAWQQTSIVAGILALSLVLSSLLLGKTSELHIYGGAALALLAWVLAWAYVAAPAAWIGSGLAQGSLTYAVAFYFPHWDFFSRGFPVALLAHATLTMLAGLGFRQWLKKVETAAGQSQEDLTLRVGRLRILQGPLVQSSLIGSFLALPFLFLLTWDGLLAAAVHLLWLSALWLVLSCTWRWPALFAGFQTVLCLAVLVATTAWLTQQPWFIDHPQALRERLWDPRSLQMYGLSLGLLSLVWIGTRLVLQSRPLAEELLEPVWPAVDRLVLGGLVLGQLALAVLGIWPIVLHELVPDGTVAAIALWPSEVLFHAHGPGAWALLALVGLVLIIALWERRGSAAVLGLVIAALTVPVLTSGGFEEVQATGLALRWGLSGCFLACSAGLWLRDPLYRLARTAGCRVAAGGPLAAVVQWLLVLGAVVPVLALTITGALIYFTGGAILRPVEDSFFAQINWIVRLALPLALLALGLTGHAVRERSPGYAFSAGLVVNLAVTGGYALASRDLWLGEEFWVQLIQLGTLTAGLWLIAWLLTRAWLQPRAAWTESPRTQPLLAVQFDLAVAGNICLIGWALCLLIGNLPAEVPTWTREAGSPLGWLALAAVAVGGILRLAQLGQTLSPRAAGLLGCTAVGLLACTVERWLPQQGWGYRTLMIGWGAYPLALVLAGWRLIARRTRLEDDASNREILRATAYWVRVASILAVLLGLKAALRHQDHLWAAAAIGLACPAAAIMAVWRRREGWALAAGLGVNLAASLVVWHWHLHSPLADWWVLLLQANVIATALVALLWLAMRKRLYGRLELSLNTGPLLGLYVCLGLIVTALLLVPPVAGLFAHPGDRLAAEVALAGEFWGWPAWLLITTAAAWYAWQAAPQSLLPVSSGLGLGLGALAACSLDLAGVNGLTVYLALLVVWLAVACVTLAVGWTGHNPDRGPLAGWIPPFPSSVPAAMVRAFAMGLGSLVVVFALRAALVMPAAAEGAAALTVLVLALTVGMAFWAAHPVYAYASGFLVNVAGSMIWLRHGAATPESFLFTQVLCCGLGAALWSVLDLLTLKETPPWTARGGWLPFSHLAVTLGLCPLGLMIVAALASTLYGAPAWAIGPLAWASLSAVILATVLCLWDADAVFPAGFLYAAGLMAIGLALHGANLSPRDLCWTAPLVLAPYLLLAAGVDGSIPRLADFRDTLRIPSRRAGWSRAWFVPAQSIGAALVVGLSLWMALEFSNTWNNRLAGPVAAALLVPAGILMAGRGAAGIQTGLRFATLVLGVLVVAEVGWATFLDTSAQAPGWLWLHGSVILMVTLALLTVVYGVGFTRVLPCANAWADSCRRFGPVLGVLASVVLAAVLVQEAVFYDAPKIVTTLLSRMLKTPGAEALPPPTLTAVDPMTPVAIGLVAVAMLGLIVAGLCFAVLPGRDPFGLSERQRTIYVYGAEVLLVLVFVHFRLTMSGLFRREFFAHYWPFIVMAIAFAGAGLSEFFHRRGLRVLAEPLERTGVFLPLLPVLAFWVYSPGNYALVWFLAGLLYGFLSVARRSFRFALLAALAMNAGLWVLLHSQGIFFVEHPQLWLIPLALVALVAEHLNRDRLTPYQSAMLRYLALIVIYVSSTADMFIAGLGHSTVLPLVLAVLSILGILAGMVLRVRAFLFLGISFLLLVVASMIWYAGYDQRQTWILWSSGIVLGIAILALFGIFEKRRNDVLRLVEELKAWK